MKKTNINSTHNLAIIIGRAIGLTIVSQKSKLKEQKSKTKNQKKQTESLTEVKSLEHKMNENHCKYQYEVTVRHILETKNASKKVDAKSFIFALNPVNTTCSIV